MCWCCMASLASDPSSNIMSYCVDYVLDKAPARSLWSCCLDKAPARSLGPVVDKNPCSQAINSQNLPLQPLLASTCE